MHRLVVGFGFSVAVGAVLQDFVLRVLHLHPMGRELEPPEQDDALMGMEDVVEKRLVEEDRAQDSSRIPDEHLENLETRTPRGPYAAADDLPRHRRRGRGSERGNRLKRAAILVPDRKAIQQVFDGCEADALKVGRAPGSNAFQILKGRIEGDHPRELEAGSWKLESLFLLHDR